MQAMKTIIVTLEVAYVVPMATASQTAINGWTFEEVARDWFERHDINLYHATRDIHRLGNGQRVMGWRVEPLLQSGNGQEAR